MTDPLYTFIEFHSLPIEQLQPPELWGPVLEFLSWGRRKRNELGLSLFPVALPFFSVENEVHDYYIATG